MDLKMTSCSSTPLPPDCTPHKVDTEMSIIAAVLYCCHDGDDSFRFSTPNSQASSSKKAPAGASEDEVERLMLQQADESLRKAQEEIERNVGKL